MGELVPEPVRFIERGERAEEAAIWRVPVALPATVGLKITLKESCCPGESVVPEERPVVDHSGLEMLTEFMVTATLPVFLTAAESV